MEFEWDVRKNEANLRKHGIAFEEALAVFEDRHEWTDVAKEVGGESRLITVGSIQPGVCVSIVYTERAGSVFRVISARPSSRKERRGYEQRRSAHRSL